jgi:putative spermidine/putrescine transport system substrate-binding protein
MKMKKWLVIILAIVTLFSGCSVGYNSGDPNWDRIVDSVSGTVVNCYIWNEDKEAFNWMNTTIKQQVKTKYNITLNLVEADRDEVYSTLVSDKVNENMIGEIDLLWLDVNDFDIFKQSELLYGPFTDRILNYKLLMNEKDLDNMYLEHIPIEKFAIPFNQNQLTFYYNEDIIYDPPMDLDDLLSIAKVNEGMVAYPDPKTELGGAFLRSILLNFAKDKSFVEKDLTDAELRELVRPGMAYLKELAPYLHGGGTSYPESVEVLDKLYADGLLVMSMSNDFLHAYLMTGEAIYPGGTRPFLLGEASVGPKEYMSIVMNAKNKSGAMVVMNELLSTETQTEKLSSRKYKGQPVYNTNLIDQNTAAAIKKAMKKKTVIDTISIMENRVHDIPSKYHDQIYKIWMETIFTEDMMKEDVK